MGRGKKAHEWLVDWVVRVRVMRTRKSLIMNALCSLTLSLRCPSRSLPFCFFAYIVSRFLSFLSFPLPTVSQPWHWLSPFFCRRPPPLRLQVPLCADQAGA